MAEAYDVLAIGSVTTDIFVRPTQLPVLQEDGKEFFGVEVGEKIKLDDVFRSGGGSAGNSSVGFAKLGLRVCPVGVIGDDEEGDHIIHKFQEQNICTSNLIVEEGTPSSISFILNAADGRRTVLHHRTTSQNLNGSVIERLPHAKGVYVGHLYSNSESVLEALTEWKDRTGGFIAWNPGKTQFQQGLTPYANVLRHTDILILNVEEAELFTAKKAPHINIADVSEDVCGKEVFYGEPIEAQYLHDLREIAKVFLALGVKQLIITDGKRGTQLFTKEYHYQLRAKKDVCVSTLGAGDSFSVGVIAATLYEKSLPEQLQWGSVCATNVVKQFGAQHGYVTKLELEKELGRLSSHEPEIILTATEVDAVKA